MKKVLKWLLAKLFGPDLQPESKYGPDVEYDATTILLTMVMNTGPIAKRAIWYNRELITRIIEEQVDIAIQRTKAAALRGEYGPIKPLEMVEDPDFIESQEIQ